MAFEIDPSYKDEVVERLLRNFTIDQAGCWVYSGYTTNGYKKIRVGDRKLAAHRVAYEVLVGPIPVGLVIDHLCRNRACINPGHLRPVTQRENILAGEGIAPRNAAKTHCPQGHPYDETNTNLYQGRRYCRACAAGRRRAA